MFARFTAEAREAVVFAQEEAARLRHPWLGTEHLLLGLLRRTDTPASRVLSSLGVTAASAEQALLDEFGPRPRSISSATRTRRLFGPWGSICKRSGAGSRRRSGRVRWSGRSPGDEGCR
jgi:ATP-dependent Clp protease ATP-binding subunit ClpA